MGQINVVCATSARPNPGMASVDLGFHALAKRHRFDPHVTFWQLGTAAELHAHRPPQERVEIASRESVPFPYRNALGHLDEICAGDAVVFWGDFMHMAHYQDDIGRRLAGLGLAPSVGEGAKISSRLFLLADAPEDALARTISFGGNLLFNGAADYHHPVYARLLRRFVRGIDSIWMRDVFSAMTVSRLRQSSGEGHLGFDCSLFLQPEDLLPLPRRWTLDPALGRGKVGLYFGRRSSIGWSALCRFAEDLSRRMNAEPQWFPWRMARGLPGRRIGWWRFRGIQRIASEGPPRLGDLFELVRRYRLIITDTYHVCVNAWRMGTPAICIGEADPKSDWDSSAGPAFAWRDKRLIFHAMNDAQEFFVHASEIADPAWRRKRVDHLIWLLRQPEIVAGVRRRVQEQGGAVEQQLVARIKRLTGPALVRRDHSDLQAGAVRLGGL